MKHLLLSLVLWVGFVFSATAATIGSLTYDESIAGNEVITDSLNNLEWLRWDVFLGLDYADTVAAISTGGAYDGWSIAGNNQAQQFVDAIFGTNNCTASNTLICGNSLSLGQVTGNNYTVSSANYAFFLSDNGTGQEVGFLGLVNSSFSKSNEWGSIVFADSKTSGSVTAIPWLLYRNAQGAVVPESSSIFIFAIGLLGLFGFVRRKI